MKKIVVIGGGFAGFNLAKSVKSGYEITLVDRNNYLFFPPLLYQVATGFLEPSAISYPFRKMLRKNPNVRFKMGELLHVDLQEKKIVLTTGELHYDYLVFATGTETNYFGMENVKRHAIPMKTIGDALEMRNHILSQLEKATTLINEPQEIPKKLNMVVAGGGPTGVEVAGMLAEMQTYIYKKDYPEFRNLPAEGNIYILDAAPQLLSPMSKKSQDNAYKALEKLGVKIVLNARVVDYIDHKVILSNGETIETENLIWASGVTSQVFEGIPKDCYGQGRRLKVDIHNRVEGLENVFAVGDTCLMLADAKFPNGHPQLAQVALQQGRNLAKNFAKMLAQKPLLPFAYKDKGTMAIIGRNKAVVDISPRLHFSGFIAWSIWAFIHLIFLVNYRNKIITFYDWVVAYFTKDQALRMMIRPSNRKKQIGEEDI